MKIHKQLHWLVLILFTLSCARQTTPTGGPKDTIPPIVTLARPVHEQLNFKGQQVEITFNEFILLNNPKEQIIITPAVGKDFDATVRKTKAIITFENPLLPNTTYSVNFRDAVQDITEKNPARNLRLAFSTGDYIDSLIIEGTVTNLLEFKDVKDATVGLYESDTFNIFKHKPAYLTKTDDQGKFSIPNLKPGAYYVYAVQDNNKNLITDSKSESYAFRTEAIRLDSNIRGVYLPLVRLDARPLRLTSARPSATYFNIKMSKSLQSYKLQALDGPTPAHSFGADQENIRVYNTTNIEDSLAVRLHAEDSINNKVDTLLYAKFVKREIKPEAFQLALDAFIISAINGTLSGTLAFNKPVTAINYDSIFYQIDSLTRIPITPEDLQYDTIHNEIHLAKKLDRTLLIKKEPAKTTRTTAAQPVTKQPTVPAPTRDPSKKKNPASQPRPTNYQLYLGKGTLLGVEGDSSKSLLTTLQPTTLESTGMIHVEVQTKATHYITQMISKGKLVASTTNTPKSTFEDLQPGDYQIRVIIDQNNDGKWSPGNFLLKKEPEPVIYYKTEKNIATINLRANYEIGPMLITF